MKTSQNGVDFVCSWESFAARVYPDSKGVSTIGFGHAMFHGVTVTSPITLEQGKALLAQDLGFAEHAVSTLVNAALSQNQFDALVSFTFNCGVGNFQSSTLLKLLNANDTDGAAGQFQKWDRCAGVELAGLLHRRQAEANVFAQNQYTYTH